jgi:hypothetical protein
VEALDRTEAHLEEPQGIKRGSRAPICRTVRYRRVVGVLYRSQGCFEGQASIVTGLCGLEEQQSITGKSR